MATSLGFCIDLEKIMEDIMATEQQIQHDLFINLSAGVEDMYTEP